MQNIFIFIFPNCVKTTYTKNRLFQPVNASQKHYMTH